MYVKCSWVKTHNVTSVHDLATKLISLAVATSLQNLSNQIYQNHVMDAINYQPSINFYKNRKDFKTLKKTISLFHWCRLKTIFLWNRRKEGRKRHSIVSAPVLTAWNPYWGHSHVTWGQQTRSLPSWVLSGKYIFIF